MSDRRIRKQCQRCGHADHAHDPSLIVDCYHPGCACTQFVDCPIPTAGETPCPFGCDVGYAECRHTFEDCTHAIAAMRPVVEAAEEQQESCSSCHRSARHGFVISQCQVCGAVDAYREANHG